MAWLFYSLCGFGISASIRYASFYNEKEGPYLETYIIFDGADLRYITAGNFQFQAYVELTITLEQNESVKAFVKTLVLSPYTNDTIKELRDFIDLQRFIIPAGEYLLNIRIADSNNPIDTAWASQYITVDLASSSASFSDILLIEKAIPTSAYNQFSKAGYDLYPKPSIFFGPHSESLTFYTELYHTEKQFGTASAFLLNLDIINLSTDEMMPDYHVGKRMTTEKLIPILQTIDISSLITGEYLLVLEVRNRQNELIVSKSTAFKRFGTEPEASDFTSDMIAKTFVSKMAPDSLRRMAYCLRYKGNIFEKNYLDQNWETADTTELRKFFYGFWQSRNQVDPRLEWARYLELVKAVEKNYGTVTTDGCASDRGRVYLTYGKPVTITRIINEPSAYPYEIWHYPNLSKKGNAKYVFYDPFRTNEYRILHSNVQGEIYDYNWYTKLAYPMGNVPTNDELFNQNDFLRSNTVGSRALEYWNNPR